MDQVANKLGPVMKKVRDSAVDPTSVDKPIVTRDGMSFLEMKYSLML
jgi:hypothetical protein